MSSVVPGQRATRQRSAVIEALAAIDDFRSAQDIHSWLRDHESPVGLTTVYRTLQALPTLARWMPCGLPKVRLSTVNALATRTTITSSVATAERPSRSRDPPWNPGQTKRRSSTDSWTSATPSRYSAPAAHAPRRRQLTASDPAAHANGHGPALVRSIGQCTTVSTVA